MRVGIEAFSVSPLSLLKMVSAKGELGGICNLNGGNQDTRTGQFARGGRWVYPPNPIIQVDSEEKGPLSFRSIQDGALHLILS